MTDGLGLRQGALALLPHDPRWPGAFARLRARLLLDLPPGTTLDHIGSTAVPDLDAKPIMDIGVSAAMTRHEQVAAALTALGWTDRGDRGGRLFIRVTDDIRTHNLHLYIRGSKDLADQIRFRDMLRADPTLRGAYQAEKRRIVDAGVVRRDYADAKSGFIRAALA